MTPHHRPVPRRLRRTGTVLLATGAALLLGTGTALAHVSITTGSVAPDSYSTVGFRVPNESDTATTTKVEIQLPADTPFAFVSAGQAPGWTITTTTTQFDAPITVGTITVDKAITSVTFTADDGAGLAPHEFAVFDLLLGPIPAVDSLAFGAVQTYDDGEIVNWTEPTPAGGEEPEHPAPVLKIAGAPAIGDGDDDAVTATTSSTDTAAAPAEDPTDTTARVLAGAGIVIGLAGVGTGIALSRRPARSGPPQGPGGSAAA